MRVKLVFLYWFHNRFRLLDSSIPNSFCLNNYRTGSRL
jgi:hypothetical protein